MPNILPNDRCKHNHTRSIYSKKAVVGSTTPSLYPMPYEGMGEKEWHYCPLNQTCSPLSMPPRLPPSLSLSSLHLIDYPSHFIIKEHETTKKEGKDHPILTRPLKLSSRISSSSSRSSLSLFLSLSVFLSLSTSLSIPSSYVFLCTFFMPAHSLSLACSIVT